MLKKRICLILALLLCLSGCGAAETVPPATEPTQTATTEPPRPPEATQPEEPTDPAEPAHSELYIEGVTQAQMLRYFEEVVLNIEYTTSQNGILRKWTEPIAYRIAGEATGEDRKVLEGLFARLNQMPGFPGIYPVTEGQDANLNILFQNRENFNLVFSHVVNGENAEGAVEFWFYNATHNIHQGTVGYRTDIDQTTRNSVLVEEIINLLGISDTVLRSDSITYQYGSEVTEPSAVDWAILQMLYDEKMTCGMDKNACAVVLAELYY